MNRLLPLMASAAVVLSAALPGFAADTPSAEEVLAQATTTTTVVSDRPAHERINLSDAQLEQLRALKDKYFAANAGKKAQLSVLKNQLRSEMTKETIDRSAVLNVQNQINALQADLANSRIAQMVDASQVFTPEQRKLMHSRMLRHGFGGGFKHGMRGHGGRGGHCGGPGGCGGARGGHGGFRGHGGPGGPGRHALRGPEGPGAPQLSAEPGDQMALQMDVNAMLIPSELPPMDGPDMQPE